MVDMDLTKEIIVFVLLVVATILSFFGIFCMYFPMRKNVQSILSKIFVYPEYTWKDIRNYIIVMCGFSFIFGILLSVLICLICG